MEAQDVYLEIIAEKEINAYLMDSLDPKVRFQDYLTMERETDTLLRKLQRFGYIDSELEKLDKKNDSTYVVQYYLGNKYEKLKIYYGKDDLSKKEIERISNEISDEYFIIPLASLATALQKLIAQKTAVGNAFAKMHLSELTKNPDKTIVASLIYDSGQKRTVDSLIIKGYEKFPRSFLKYYAGVKKGKVFNQKKLLTQNDVINSLGFVNSIKPPEALFRKDSTVVYFYFEKQNNNVFDGILGFATDVKSQKLVFNGYLNLELNNNLNYGEQLLLNYKADGNDQRSFRVKTSLPYLFKSPFGLSLELSIFKRDSTFSTTEQQARLLYQILPSSSAYLGYKSYDSSVLLDEVIAGSPVADYTSRFLTFGLNYVSFQNRALFPLKTNLILDSEIGARDRSGIKENQLRLSSLANNIFNLNFKNSIFLQNTTGILFSNTFLINELFRFGGINSIRGFTENSIDASFYSILNTEYRYVLGPSLYVHSIIDVGYFENEILPLKQKLYSFGFGLGLQSQAGIFKLNIANGNVENQKIEFANTKIHISFTSRF